MKNTIRIAVAAVAVMAGCMASARTMTMKKNMSHELLVSFDFTFDNVGAGTTNLLWMAYGTSDGGSGSYSGWDSVLLLAVVPGDTTALNDVLPPDGWGDGVTHLRFFLTSGSGIDGADRLEYIEAIQTSAGGSRYIMTKFVPNGRSRVAMDCKLGDAEGNRTFFCAREDYRVKSFTLMWCGDKWRWDYANDRYQPVDPAPGTIRHKIVADYTGVTLDGNLIAGTAGVFSDFTAGGKLSIFAANQAETGVSSYANMRLYSFKAWENGSDNATLALDLIPCRKSDGTVCLYNKVDGEFLVKNGTGDFTAGPVIATAGPEVVDSVTDLVQAANTSPSTEHVDSAFHHMSHYFRSLGDVNGNSVVDEGEVVDLLTWSSAKRNVNYPVTVCGTGAQIQHTNVEYTATYPARTTVRANGIYFPQPVTTNLDGSISGVVQTLCVTNATCWGTTNAFRVHFRWDGPTQTNFAAKCSMMRYAHVVGDTGTGISIFIKTTAGDWTNGKLGIERRNNAGEAVDQMLSIVAGRWYDLIVSRPRRVVNGSLDPSCVLCFDLMWADDSTGTEKTSSRDIVGAHAYVSQTRTDIIFGGYETVVEPTLITNGTDAVACAFRGIIDAYECWDNYMPPRNYLTPLTQAREIISGNHGAIATIGLVNGKADEFSDENPAAVYDCATMDWRKFRKTLTAANPSVSFKVNLGTDVFVTNWPQIVSLTPLFSNDAPEKCPVEVYINGKLSQRGDLRTASGRALYIGAKYMKPDADGCATFEIRRTGDLAGSVSFDAVAVCGGGSFGRHNNLMGEFIQETQASRHAIFGDRDAQHVRRAHQVYSSYSSHDYFAFYLPRDSIGRETYKGLFAVTYGTTARAKVYFNGTEVLDMSAQESSHPDYAFDIPANLLKPGLNEISVNGNGSTSTGWLNFDCIQLWAEGEEYNKTGTTFIIW